jgi:hypothetical protein
MLGAQAELVLVRSARLRAPLAQRPAPGAWSVWRTAACWCKRLSVLACSTQTCQQTGDGRTRSAERKDAQYHRDHLHSSRCETLRRHVVVSRCHVRLDHRRGLLWLRSRACSAGVNSDDVPQLAPVSRGDRVQHRGAAEWGGQRAAGVEALECGPVFQAGLRSSVRGSTHREESPAGLRKTGV